MVELEIGDSPFNTAPSAKAAARGAGVRSAKKWSVTLQKEPPRYVHLTFRSNDHTRSTMAAPWGPGHAPAWRPRHNTLPDTDTGSPRRECPTGLLPGPCTDRVGRPPHPSIRWSSIISRRFSPKPHRPTLWATVFPHGLRSRWGIEPSDSLAASLRGSRGDRHF